MVGNLAPSLGQAVSIMLLDTESALENALAIAGGPWTDPRPPRDMVVDV